MPILPSQSQPPGYNPHRNGRKFTDKDDKGHGLLFPKWRYQIICHNQPDMTPKEVWEDYNRAKIELTIRELDYDHFITSVPTGNLSSNFAYFWQRCILPRHRVGCGRKEFDVYDSTQSQW